MSKDPVYDFNRFILMGIGLYAERLSQLLLGQPYVINSGLTIQIISGILQAIRQFFQRSEQRSGSPPDKQLQHKLQQY